MFRVFIAKDSKFESLSREFSLIQEQLDIHSIKGIKKINLYDVFNAPEKYHQAIVKTILADPITDHVLTELPKTDHFLIIEPLPGQFDQRADSAEQCIRLLGEACNDVKVTTAVAWLIDGVLNEKEFLRLKKFFH